MDIHPEYLRYLKNMNLQNASAETKAKVFKWLDRQPLSDIESFNETFENF